MVPRVNRKKRFDPFVSSNLCVVSKNCGDAPVSRSRLQKPKRQRAHTHKEQLK